MMFKFIYFGKLIEQGISLYWKKDYMKAREVFYQALTVNPQDFSANFWQARVNTMLGGYAVARELLVKCRELSPQVAEQLIDPWENLINGLENDYPVFSRQLAQHDAEADHSLRKCYFKKYFSGAELAVITFLYIIGWFTNFESYWGMMPGVVIPAYLVATVQLSYFHSTTLLPLNLWQRYQWVKTEIGKLVSQPSFLLLIIGVFTCIGVYVFGEAALFAKAYGKAQALRMLQHINPRESLWWLAIGFLAAPATEELIFRLAWYNYLAKYNTYVAYIGVSILFMLGHLALEPVHFLLSLGFIWVYNRYQTIIAPMIIHSVYNISVGLVPLLVSRMFI